ncbi:hypothetical protein AJ80_06524 [Polytolypa hystricis UAMH7299]|uniref:YDG domain-containing protein n=1 Tax=Polytolypa hystricis (strain UAMH7299) TaxID=1447883 RepID=A0A2B7XVD2_POLH7|nr:hypothetical protein AJ80_06524 [Polytolypa hystricis UAMH7299]
MNPNVNNPSFGLPADSGSEPSSSSFAQNLTRTVEGHTEVTAFNHFILSHGSESPHFAQNETISTDSSAVGRTVPHDLIDPALSESLPSTSNDGISSPSSWARETQNLPFAPHFGVPNLPAYPSNALDELTSFNSFTSSPVPWAPEVAVESDESDLSESHPAALNLSSTSASAPDEGTSTAPIDPADPLFVQGTETTERPAKRAKIDPDNECTCHISTTCKVAARNGTKDCRPPVKKRVTKRSSRRADTVRILQPTSEPLSTRSREDILHVLVLFQLAVSANPIDPNAFGPIKARLDELPFTEVNSASLNVLNELMDATTGLPAIARHPHTPWYIRLDLEFLMSRWQGNDLHTNLMRGIKGREKSNEGKFVSFARFLDHDYQHRASNFVGEGHLRNGAWYPFMLAAMRDGAHYESQGGISGMLGHGAVSIVLSHGGKGRAHADVDEGDRITYSGTRATDNGPSDRTKLMIQAFEKRTSIRVFRSSNLKADNPYRPKKGFRYDGLYRIVAQEEIGDVTRFVLTRLDGQTPIRHSGVEARPTEVEVAQLKSVQNVE